MRLPSPMSLYSVIIPARNAERFITQALDSVQQQTCRADEVVVVDDGSTDRTRDLADAWRRDHPDVVIRLCTQPHQGIGAARNTGIQAASGRFVAFLDADDYWVDRKLERVSAVLENDPAIDLVCHDEWLVRENGHRSRLRYGPHRRYDQLLFRGNCLSTSATVVRRRLVLDVGGFSEELRINGVEDYDLWLRLAKAGGRFTYLHEPLGVYRVHPLGVTSRIEEHRDHVLAVLDAHYQQWTNRSLRYRYAMRRQRAAAIRGAAHALMQQGDHARAWHSFGQALEQDPFAWKTCVLGLLNLARVRR